MGNACQAPAAAPEGSVGGGRHLVLPVICSQAWGLGSEDIWQVEVPPTATVAALKAQIEELYNVQVEAQSLSLASDSGASVGSELDDAVKVQTLVGKDIYLRPRYAPGGMLDAPGAEDEVAALAEMDALMDAAHAAQDRMADALQDVKYKVTFERPAEAGGTAAGRLVELELPALELVGTAQQLVELEMFGEIGRESVFLVLNGELLPPGAPLFHAGVEEGTTVIVATEPPPMTEEQQQMLQLLAAGGGMPFGAAELEG